MSLTQFTGIVNSYEDAIAAYKVEIERLQTENERLAKGVVLEISTAQPILDLLVELVPTHDVFSLLLELRAAIARANGEPDEN